MRENAFYRVSWNTTSGANESKDFPEWDAALALYEDLIEDRRLEKANLVEVTEREVRCFEHEERRKPVPQE